MLENYHTHTYRCHHADGKDEDYVKTAVRRGVKLLGFSDHTPYFYDGDYVSPAKMKIDEIGDYVSSILALKKKYADVIDIKVGFETEYFPKFFDRLIEEYRKYPIDYIILGQHVIGNESTPDMINSFAPTKDRGILTRFCDQCIEALETGRFTYFAHPDIVDYIAESDEDEAFREAEYERLIRAAMKTETPIEVNLCGMRLNRIYPSDNFWRVAGKLGAETVIGCDAHAPSHVADPEELARAYSFAERHSLKLIEELKLKNPLF